jgi:hypothetical protein
MQKAKSAKLKLLRRGGTGRLSCPNAMPASRTDAVVPIPSPFQ